MLCTLPDVSTETPATNDTTDLHAITSMLAANDALIHLPQQYADIISRIDQLTRSIHRNGDGEQQALTAWLTDAKAQLLAAHEHAAQLVNLVTGLMARLDALTNATDFSPQPPDNQRHGGRSNGA
jgi:hypothetical protein